MESSGKRMACAFSKINVSSLGEERDKERERGKLRGKMNKSVPGKQLALLLFFGWFVSFYFSVIAVLRLNPGSEVSQTSVLPMICILHISSLKSHSIPAS